MSWVTVASRSSGNRCWERSMTMMHFVSTLSIGTCTSRFLTLCQPLDPVFLAAVNVRREGSRQPITPNSEFIYHPLHRPSPPTLPFSPFRISPCHPLFKLWSLPLKIDRPTGFYAGGLLYLSYLLPLFRQFFRVQRDNIFSMARVLWICRIRDRLAKR